MLTTVCEKNARLLLSLQYNNTLRENKDCVGLTNLKISISYRPNTEFLTPPDMNDDGIT